MDRGRISSPKGTLRKSPWFWATPVSTHDVSSAPRGALLTSCTPGRTSVLRGALHDGDAARGEMTPGARGPGAPPWYDMKCNLTISEELPTRTATERWPRHHPQPYFLSPSSLLVPSSTWPCHTHPPPGGAARLSAATVKHARAMWPAKVASRISRWLRRNRGRAIRSCSSTILSSSRPIASWTCRPQSWRTLSRPEMCQ